MKRKTFMIMCPFCGTRLIDCDDTLNCYIKCKKCNELWFIEIREGPDVHIVDADYYNSHCSTERDRDD